jgi:hypothetical protein
VCGLVNADRPGQNAPPTASRWWLVSLLSLAVVLSSVTSVDQYARGDFDLLFRRALVTFALARTLNGVISAVQGTEIALQPAGVGVTLTPGEILDPVNDLVERFSWIMLGATISLGVQQVLLDIGQWWGTRMLVALCGLLWLWSALRRARVSAAFPAAIGPALLRVLLALLFLRFAVPVVLIANEAVFELFLQPRYLASTGAIESAGADIQLAGADPQTEDGGEEGGLLGMLGRAYDSTRDTLNLKHRVAYIRQRAAAVIEHLIQLSVVFILQAAVLPIAFLWLLMHLLKALVYRSTK